MWFTKSSSICKNLRFIWHLDCHQISNLPPLLHAENCCTIADKMHSKTEASLIHFSWNFYRIFFHKCRACIPNFKPIQIDLFTQTWLRSLLAQIFNFRQISIHWAILHQIWIKLETNLFEYFHKTYIHPIHLLNVISWNYPTQTNPNLITKLFNPFNHLIASNIAYLSNSINSYAPKWNNQQEIYLG
jgi:hypothetical protein